MAKSNIEWTDETLNPIGLVGGGHGCAKVSPGCDNCYAEVMNKRLKHLTKADYEVLPFDGRPRKYELRDNILEQPYHWRKPRMVFMCSMMDLFHHDVPDEMIDFVWLTMEQANIHTYQVLTKRPDRMKQWIEYYRKGYETPDNVWLGVTAENQKFADKRIPILLQTPAAKRFVSLEPLLGEIDLRDYFYKCHLDEEPSLDWVIIGCETGKNVRYCDPEWIDSIVKQCIENGVPYFVKAFHKKQQNGKFKVIKDISQFPSNWARQFPEVI